MRATVALLGLFVLLMPLAAAQEDAPEDESQDAWVEDCPPDMMCAMGDANESAEDKPTYDGNCDGEICAYGPDGCIECSGPADERGETCMDGADAGEDCRDDVQYLDGRGPADCESCRGGDGESVQGEAAKTVPLPQVLVVFGALAAAVLVVRRAA